MYINLLTLILLVNIVKSIDQYCLNGNRWDRYCCSSICITEDGNRYCGLDECGYVNGTYNKTIDDNCCTGAIGDKNISCSVSNAPCVITGDIPPEYTPTSAPTTPIPSSAPTTSAPTSVPTSAPISAGEKTKYYDEDWFIPAVGGGVIFFILLMAIIWQLVSYCIAPMAEIEEEEVYGIV